MRDGELVDEMQFVKVYKAPTPIKIANAVGFVVTALMMTLFPSFSCVFDSAGIAGGYSMGVSGALSDKGTTVSYVIWILMFVSFFAGLVFTWNDRPKVIPIISSAYMTFATIYSSTILKLSGVAGDYGILKEYTMAKGYYAVLAANWILTVLTVIMIIKTPKKVELRFDSDE